MIKKIGIIGSTGRMGTIVAELIKAHPAYAIGPSFSRAQTATTHLTDVFERNDIVIDFSSALLVPDILRAGLAHPTPLILGTTGWSQEKLMSQIQQLADRVPVVIAPNTSLGACLQRYVVRQVANILGESYDIDIFEQHHRHKIDSPSGTAHALSNEIKRAKHTQHNKKYTSYTTDQGARPPHSIGLAVERSGNLPGTHRVSFTSAEEQLVIEHKAFDRRLFAKGGLAILHWLHTSQPTPGIYSMLDVLGIQH